MRKILVIGSNSFAGSDFIDFLLNKKFKVFGVSRKKEINKEYLRYKSNKNLKKFKFKKINLNAKNDLKKLIKLIKKEKITYIINFAARNGCRKLDTSKLVSHQCCFKLNSDKELSKLKIKKYLNFTTPEVYGTQHL